jgi:lysophospholipase L1-like esterase
VRRLTIALAALLALPAAAAPAQPSFRWTVPERLQGGTVGVARTVDQAATAPPTTIVLTTCARDPAWSLDGKDVTPRAAGRCDYRLDLGDAAPHTVKLAAGGDSNEQTVQARDIVIVSIGDSVASGEGNPDVPSAIDPGWLETRCHRSMRSGAAQAAGAVAAGDPHSSVTFLPLACSGATVPQGLLGPYAGVQPDRALGDLPSQVDQLAALQRRRAVDAVLLSVGANDVDFGPLAEFCLAVEDCPDRRFDPDHPLREAPDPSTPTAEAVHAAAQRELPARYDQLAGALGRAGIDPGKVIIVEYFDPTHDEHGDTCDALLPGITPEESQWAQDVVLAPLNAAVRDAAQREGWKLVGGVQAAFLDHGICAPAALRWVRRIDESLLRGAGVSGPLHPNSAGHLATAALIAPVLADVVGIDPGDAVAQASGAEGNEGSRVAWWWIPIAALAGAAIAFGVTFLVLRRTRPRPTGRAA